jgi:hypothetical protein
MQCKEKDISSVRKRIIQCKEKDTSSVRKRIIGHKEKGDGRRYWMGDWLASLRERNLTKLFIVYHKLTPFSMPFLPEYCQFLWPGLQYVLSYGLDGRFELPIVLALTDGQCPGNLRCFLPLLVSQAQDVMAQ